MLGNPLFPSLTPFAIPRCKVHHVIVCIDPAEAGGFLSTAEKVLIVPVEDAGLHRRLSEERDIQEESVRHTYSERR